MQNVLSALKDIPGVVGSFVLNGRGALASSEMPAIYPASIYPEIGRRLLSIHEAIDGQVQASTECVLKFDSYWFLARRTAQCFLGIVTTDAVNYPALRMATNVALKQICDSLSAETKSVESAGGLPTQAVAAPVAAPAPAPAPPVVAAKPRRLWRGQYVED
ncbi:MAG TPA: hypothetical protein VF614_07290 [Chthoniobacteraceae bacterium]|jgi:hypothetical protein